MSGTVPAGAARPTGEPMEPWLRAILRCPATGSPLVDAVGPDGAPELVSTGDGPRFAYPVRDGIPVLLETEAREL